MKSLKCVATIFLVLSVLSSAEFVMAGSPEESFRKSFPKIRADAIRPAAVPGLYEVVSGSRVLYYAPGPE